MTSRRRSEGDETYHRLHEWTRGQKAAERLSAHLLKAVGFQADPVQPLGGPDGLKDIVCNRDGLTWIAGVFFPQAEPSPRELKRKFLSDLQGVSANAGDAFVFVTNQRITSGRRQELREAAFAQGIRDVDIMHLERMVHILDTPSMYGVRLEYLDIEMTKEEQLSFIAWHTDNTIRIYEEWKRDLSSVVEKTIRRVLTENKYIVGQLCLDEDSPASEA